MIYFNPTMFINFTLKNFVLLLHDRSLKKTTTFFPNCWYFSLIYLNPFNPTRHLVDDMQNAKEIFCVLSSSFKNDDNIWCVSHSICSSHVAVLITASVLSFLSLALMNLYFKRSWLWRQNARERDLAIFFSCSCRTKEKSGIERINISMFIFSRLI